MFTLAWLLLPDLPEYRTGLIIVGLARCIAMVLIWNDLACGDREAAAVLVAINSLFQIVAYSLLGCFYLELLPGWLGLDTDGARRRRCGRSPRSSLIFLGIPLAAGYLTRRVGAKPAKGTRVVRAAVPAPHRPRSPCTACCSPSSCSSPCRATRSPPTRGTSPASPCRCSPTSPSCGRRRSSLGLRLGFAVPAHRDARVHRGGQQLRARHRGRDRRVRRHLRPGPRRRRRAADRGARCSSAWSTSPCGPDAATTRPHQGALELMNCFDCAAAGRPTPARRGVPRLRRSGLRRPRRERPTIISPAPSRHRPADPVEPPARLIRCRICAAAHDAAHQAQPRHTETRPSPRRARH